MLKVLRIWIRKRQTLRKLWQADAQFLIDSDERNSYYSAQRLAARSRASGDVNGFFHWSKVAAEVAQRSRVAEMDFAVVQSIVRAELGEDPGDD
jgi:hypothetical protein